MSNSVQESARPELVRTLGLGTAFSVLTGSVIGSGVFLVAADIGKSVPSPWGALAVWLAAGVFSLLGGLTFAELGAALPGTGGQYVYLRRAFGAPVGFLFAWAHTLILAPGTTAGLAVGFATFFSALVPLSPLGIKLLASASILGFTLLNLLGVKRGARVLDVLTTLKIVALVGIALAGLLLPAGPTLGSAGSALSIPLSAYGLAMIAAFWAYEGWTALTHVAGEVRNPQRNIPLASAGGLLAVLVLYLGVNLAYYRALDPAAIAGSAFVGADASVALLGSWASRAVGIAVILSTLGCLNVGVLSGARVTYAVAADGDFPAPFARVHPRYRVPSFALKFQAAMALLLAWSGRYDQLFTYVVCAAFLFYGLTAAAVMVLRWREPALARPYRVPFYPVLPLLYIAFVVAFTWNAFLEKPWEGLIGLGIVLLGLPFYALFAGARVKAAQPGTAPA
jgi:basic amino acid/polyamine antiporter, APA family